MLAKFKNLVYRAWNSEGRKVFHTFWQAAGGQLLSALLLARSTKDVQMSVGAALAVGLAAVKAAYLSRKA